MFSFYFVHPVSQGGLCPKPKMLYLCRPKYLTMSEKEPGGKRAPRKRIQRDQKTSESGSYEHKGSIGSGNKMNPDHPRFSKNTSAPSRPGFGKRGETSSPGSKPTKSRSSRTEQSRTQHDNRISNDRPEKSGFKRRKFGADNEQKPGNTRKTSRNTEEFVKENSKITQSARGFKADKTPESRAQKSLSVRKKFADESGAGKGDFGKHTGQAGKDQREWKPRRGVKTQQGRTRTDKKEIIRLNKYLADAGICSRREADDLIQAGAVSVNGVIVTELGTKVSIHDKVNYGGQTLRREKLRYVLLNKPKGYITTSDDPFNRKTVMELVKTACEERIYPVGRLDRNTLGLLLLTNDGDLAKKMMHPKHGVAKLYHVFLDKPLTKHDLLQIAEGLELEDGKAEVDAISYVNKDDTKKEIGIEIHSGKNRIVRRIFEHLGYHVVKLDRVMLGGLTKLDLPRGKFRHLTSAEISMLMRIR